MVPPSRGDVRPRSGLTPPGAPPALSREPRDPRSYPSTCRAAIPCFGGGVPGPPGALPRPRPASRPSPNQGPVRRVAPRATGHPLLPCHRQSTANRSGGAPSERESTPFYEQPPASGNRAARPTHSLLVRGMRAGRLTHSHLLWAMRALRLTHSLPLRGQRTSLPRHSALLPAVRVPRSAQPVPERGQLREGRALSRAQFTLARLWHCAHGRRETSTESVRGPTPCRGCERRFV